MKKDFELELIKYTVWLNEQRVQSVSGRTPLRLSIVEDYMDYLEQVEIEGAIPFEMGTDEQGRPIFIEVKIEGGKVDRLDKVDDLPPLRPRSPSPEPIKTMFP